MNELVNYMEKMVFNKLDEVLASRKDICHCDQCKMDIAAIALNHLEPRYIVTDRGKLFTKIDTLETQFSVDIMIAIGKGIEVVSKQPRHAAGQES